VLLRHSSVLGVLLDWIVVGAVRFLTEPGMFESMGVSEMCALFLFKFVISECTVDVGISEDEVSEGGHAAFCSVISRVFMHS